VQHLQLGLCSGITYNATEDLDGCVFDSSSDEDAPSAPRKKSEAPLRQEDLDAVFNNLMRYSVAYAREFPNSNLLVLLCSTLHLFSQWKRYMLDLLMYRSQARKGLI